LIHFYKRQDKIKEERISIRTPDIKNLTQRQRDWIQI